ncbi:MAG: DNA polymerase IV [Ignavibacteriae bacterium]|nr:DNA polymerase IV [Ignavibacteria bacterium]MBI3364727.1 DNA polymerase IV [Ignavibacteriota bacterium]
MSAQQKYIAHLDLDCFFVSVERIKNPKLNGKAVIVGGSPDGRGVVASASYEARKYGVRSAMPTAQALRRCPHAIVVSGHHDEYSDYSRRLYKFMLTIAPIVERASIDEMNIDLTGCESLYNDDLPGFMCTLQHRIWQEFRLPCTIALAANKLVAKIAAGTVKPSGIIFVPHGTEREFLSSLPIGVIPGVGTKTEEVLQKKGIRIITDCQAFSKEQLEELVGSFGHYLFEAVNGRGGYTITPEQIRKSISREETFARDINDRKELEKILFSLVESVCSTLRKHRWKAKTITVKFRYADFTTFTRRQTCTPTNYDPAIFSIARELLAKAFEHPKPLRLIGIGVSNFVDDEEREISLFPTQPDGKQTVLSAIDSLRKKYGDDVIHIGRVS